MNFKTRQIKPEFFQSEQVASVSFEARLMFVGLWTIADRDGKFEDKPPVIRGLLFSHDETLDSDSILSELDKVGLIHRYEVDGKRLGIIPKFVKHQNIHPNERKSELPFPCNYMELNVMQCNYIKPNDSAGVTNSNSKSKSRIESKSKREDKSKSSDHVQAVAYFCEEYESWSGVKYDFKGAKDAALVKRLLSTFGLDGFKKIASQIFKSNDSFISDTGREIGVLSACANKLMQEASGKKTGMEKLGPHGRATALAMQAVLRKQGEIE